MNAKRILIAGVVVWIVEFHIRLFDVWVAV